MKTNKGEVTVQSFHYDVESPAADVKSDLQISIEHPDLLDAKGNPLSEDEGKIFQIVIPFEVHPENAPFKVSGLIGQVVQLVGFQGKPEDLEPKQVEQISRPVVEYIETLTYQVTVVALNRGVSLNFTAHNNVEPNDTTKDKK
ncbi:DUF1149 family protein [Companilactobacillus allii]|uniref:Uncharacterized protein n=1 Tax=Companilactobacillus allii TaxID=1847728 RepID=A0A1P8Q355_9LACO|nr:DUF1149 family protein [Companilactobacillus allii]APX72294.1 hypothetical protein BTM29_06850 [Companilactobacillus allii]USQ69385.1 DUF1149 family protein [Companilactobacillus allii]